MTHAPTREPPGDPGPPLDRAHSGVVHPTDLSGSVGGLVERVRSGDIGTLPVIGGLIVVCVIFQSLNSVFLSSRNLVELLVQLAPIGVISLGIVMVLLVGEIDLSVGSMSGVSSAVVAILFVNDGLPVALAIVVAALTGVAVGLTYSFMYNRFGVPSFVISLAGLLSLLGVQLRLLGSAGSINIPFAAFLGKFGNSLFLPGWLSYVLSVVAGASVVALGLSRRRSRGRAGLSVPAAPGIIAKGVALGVALLVMTWYLGRSRGVSWMFFFFLALVIVMDYFLTRTGWGRALFAVGGNAEAARRAGIKVHRVYLSAFVLCSTFAAVGGVLEAAYGIAASNQTGTGNVNLDAIAAAVIGGTSLFGGRGSAWAALLGMLVIESISSGLSLLSPSPDVLYIVTGLVLLLSVALDSVARRSRLSHGKG